MKNNAINTRDPEINFEEFWMTFSNRYPFFNLRNVDWKKQYDIFKPKVTPQTSDDELFDILCQMIDPLDDGHVVLKAKLGRNQRIRSFNPEPKPKFHQEFTKREIVHLFNTTENTLVAQGFEPLKETPAWILHYCRSREFGYLRILELEGVEKRKLTSALDKIAEDFKDLNGIIIDIRNNPGGDDSIVLKIVNRFCDRKRVAFHRKTKIGPGEEDFKNFKTWNIKQKGAEQFIGPVVLLTCDSVFSGGEIFALAMKQLPHVTIIGDHTNGIFSYQLEKILPNGWRYRLSYQVYYSADMECYEGKGVPADITLLNKRTDIENNVDPLIICALQTLKYGKIARETSVSV